MSERFMIDTAGTLIDMETRDTFDYVSEVVDLLNSQDMHIFLLKCVIQTITAESMDKNISHKRILEIKKHWYDKLYGDDLND